MKVKFKLSINKSLNKVIRVVTLLWVMSLSPLVHAFSAGSDDVIYINGFENMSLGEDPGIIFQNAKMSFIANSYMGAFGGLNNYLELSVLASDNPVDLNTLPARQSEGGWYWGDGLSEMTDALDRIELEGDYDSCTFLDSSSLEVMRAFADRLFAACTKVILFADAGGHNPVTWGSNHFAVTENTLNNARIMQSEYPDLIVVPTALIFYDLTVDPPVAVPRLDYLYGVNNIHQTGLGTLVNAFSMFAVMTASSPVGLEFVYDQPAFGGNKFMQGENILLGYNQPVDFPNDFMLFDDNTRELIQQRVFELLVQWNNQATEFD